MIFLFQLSTDARIRGQYKDLAKEFELEHENNKPNPVIQRVKIIMVNMCYSQTSSNFTHFDPAVLSIILICYSKTVTIWY